MMKNNISKPHRKTSPLYVAVFIILMIYVFVLLIPLVWGLFISFVSRDAYSEYLHNPLILPTDYSFSNYINGFNDFSIKPLGSFTEQNIFEILLQTIVYAGSCSIAATLVPCICAYASARFNFRFGKVIYGIVIVTMAIPIVGNLPSEIVVAQNLGIFDNLWLFWIMKANFLSIYFLLFHSIFKGVPMAYTEAAKIDGASNFRVMTNCIMPFAFGTIGIVFLLNFINFWNDYQIPYYYLPSYPVVGTAVFNFSLHYEKFGGIPQLIAMIFIVAIPIIALAIAFNKRLMSNLFDGGIKE